MIPIDLSQLDQTYVSRTQYDRSKLAINTKGGESRFSMTAPLLLLPNLEEMTLSLDDGNGEHLGGMLNSVAQGPIAGRKYPLLRL